MIKTIVGAAIVGAAIVSVALTSVPASARVMGCDTESVAKVGGGLEAMADGPGRAAAAIEVAAVNEALSKGDVHACAIHVRKADQLEVSKPGS